MAEIITDGSQKELKKHGSDEFPLLVSYEKLSGYKSGSFLWHWHPEIEITLVLDGQILYKVNQCTYHMKAGDILLGNANVLHAGFMEDMKDGKYVSITFLPKIIYGSYGSILRRKYVEPFLHNFSLPAVYIDYSQPWHEIFSEYVREIITLYEEKKGILRTGYHRNSAKAVALYAAESSREPPLYGTQQTGTQPYA